MVVLVHRGCVLCCVGFYHKFQWKATKNFCIPDLMIRLCDRLLTFGNSYNDVNIYSTIWPKSNGGAFCQSFALMIESKLHHYTHCAPLERVRRRVRCAIDIPLRWSGKRPNRVIKAGDLRYNKSLLRVHKKTGGC